MGKNKGKAKSGRPSVVIHTVQDFRQQVFDGNDDKLIAIIRTQTPLKCPLRPVGDCFKDSTGDRALVLAQKVRQLHKSGGSWPICGMCDVSCKARQFRYAPPKFPVAKTTRKVVVSPQPTFSGPFLGAFARWVSGHRPPYHLVIGPGEPPMISLGENFFLGNLQEIAKKIPNNKTGLAISIVEALLAHDVRSVDAHGLVRLCEIAAETVNDPDYLAKNVVLNVGFGGSDAVPLRALSYVPWKVFMALKDLKITPPRLRLFTGQMLAAHILGMDVNVLWRSTSVLFALVKLFAREFHPQVESQLIFDFDRPMGWRGLLSNLEALSAEIQRRSRSDPLTADAMTVLEGMAQHHTENEDDLGLSLDKALLYGGGHAPTFGDFTFDGSAHSRWLGEMDHLPKHMVGYGTKAEINFWVVRKATVAQAKSVLTNVKPASWVMCFNRVGEDKPPYYMHPRGDLNHTAALQWNAVWGSLPSTVQHDLDLLACCAGGVNNLVAWSEDVHQRFFGQVERTGTRPEELMAHWILGSPAVHNAVGGGDDVVQAASVIGSMGIPDEESLAELARNVWMGI